MNTRDLAPVSKWPTARNLLHRLPKKKTFFFLSLFSSSSTSLLPASSSLTALVACAERGGVCICGRCAPSCYIPSWYILLQQLWCTISTGSVCVQCAVNRLRFLALIWGQQAAKGFAAIASLSFLAIYIDSIPPRSS